MKYLHLATPIIKYNYLIMRYEECIQIYLGIFN